MKKIAILFFIFFSLAINSCSSCKTNEVLVEVSKFISLELTITNPDQSSFVENLQPLNLSSLYGTFQTTVAYLPPDEPPQETITAHFSFKKDALPNGESIYDQNEGEQFQVGTAPGQNYDRINVIYEEFKAGHVEGDPPFWSPTTYNGTVTLIAEDQVQFDITFTDGVESRRVLNVYEFFTNNVTQEVGNCD